MNPITEQRFTDALHKTNFDKSAAAMLALADAIDSLQESPLFTQQFPQEPPIPETTLTVAEAAKRLKVATNTVYNLVERGQLKHHRIGRIIRILAADIDAYQRQCTEAMRPRIPSRYHYKL